MKARVDPKKLAVDGKPCGGRIYVWKALQEGFRSPYGRDVWTDPAAKPKDGRPGKWMRRYKSVRMCYMGYHGSPDFRSLCWAVDNFSRLFVMEIRGPMKWNPTRMYDDTRDPPWHDEIKVCAAQARLVAEVPLDERLNESREAWLIRNVERWRAERRTGVRY